MTHLPITGQPVQDRYQTQFAGTEKAVAGEKAIGNSKTSQTNDFSMLAAQPGVIASLLSGQSVMISDNEVKPALAKPSKGIDKINTEQNHALVEMSASLQVPSEVNQLEHLAAAASSLLASQNSIAQVNGKGAETSKPNTVAATRAVSSTAGDTRLQPAVAGGADITATNKVGSGFINVMGDMRLVDVMNTLSVTLNKAEAISSKLSAKAATRMVEAANRAGTRTIESAKERMNGAITSGVMGVAGQGFTTSRSIKALNKESSSITHNLGAAHKHEFELRANQNQIKQSADTMLHKNTRLDGNVKGSMSKHDPLSIVDSEQLRRNHNAIQNNTQKIRHQSEFGNQSIHSTQGIVNNSFDVAAAGQTKQADLARADQSVNSEISSVHQQAGKKANETRTALNQALEAALNTNNSTVSSIAERTR